MYTSICTKSINFIIMRRGYSFAFGFKFFTSLNFVLCQERTLIFFALLLRQMPRSELLRWSSLSNIFTRIDNFCHKKFSRELKKFQRFLLYTVSRKAPNSFDAIAVGCIFRSFETDTLIMDENWFLINGKKSKQAKLSTLFEQINVWKLERILLF